MPEFLVATLAVLVFAVQLKWLPALSYEANLSSPGQMLHSFALPVLSLGSVIMAQMMRMTRAAVIDQLAAAYIEMVRLKGASAARTVLFHALPNAIGPIANAVALSLSYLLGGVIIIEVIFNYPGHRQAHGRRRGPARHAAGAGLRDDLLRGLPDPGDAGRRVRHRRQPEAEAPMTAADTRFPRRGRAAKRRPARGLVARRQAGPGRAGVLGRSSPLFAPFLLPHSLGEMSDAGVFQEHGRAALARHRLPGPRHADAASSPARRYTIGVALVATLLACSSARCSACWPRSTGGWFDAALSRVLDTLVSIPSKMLALVMIAGFGSSVPLLIAVAAIVYTPGCYRIIRSLAVNINAMDYVTVARARGEGRAYIMRARDPAQHHRPAAGRHGPALRLRAAPSRQPELPGPGRAAADGGLGLAGAREPRRAARWAASSVLAPALAIATLTIAVNLVIDNLPGHTDADRETH